MKDYLQEFFSAFSYPQEAAVTLLDAYERIMEKPTKQAFEGFLRCYGQHLNCDMAEMLVSMEGICRDVGIHEYTGKLLLFICLSKTLKQYYHKEKLEEQIWFTSMCDLKWKMMECYCVFGIWGSFVSSWFIRFFQMTCFGFGKLQFELKKLGRDYEIEGKFLTAESTVINVHLPRTGEKLDAESREKAYQMASAFFNNRNRIESSVFVCHSWILFPRNKEVLSPQSNLYAFISDYEIMEWGEYEDYKEVWRLFDVKYTGDVEQLPQNTSLRRSYADWIRKGQKTGWGYGIFVYHMDMEQLNVGVCFGEACTGGWKNG